MTDAPDLTSQPSTPEAARTALDTLRQARIDNRVTERDYLARAEYLAQVASGETVAAPANPYAEPSEQALIAEAMEPAKPHEYQIDLKVDEEHKTAADTAIRNAMSEAGVPSQYGRTLVAQIDQVMAKLEGASEKDVTAHVASVTSTLKERWGDKFAARLDAVDELVTDVATKSEFVANLIDHFPHAFADPWVMETLAYVAEHRSKK